MALRRVSEILNQKRETLKPNGRMKRDRRTEPMASLQAAYLFAIVTQAAGLG